MSETRLTALELRFTEQQALLEDLSQVLHQQQREIGLLQAEVRSLQARLEQTESQQQLPPAEKPPHF